MEAVQTSAISNQTEAMRDNTFQLKLIARHMADLTQLERRREAQSAFLREWRDYLVLFVGLLAAVLAVIVAGYNAWKVVSPAWPTRCSRRPRDHALPGG